MVEKDHKDARGFKNRRTWFQELSLVVLRTVIRGFRNFRSWF